MNELHKGHIFKLGPVKMLREKAKEKIIKYYIYIYLVI